MGRLTPSSEASSSAALRSLWARFAPARMASTMRWVGIVAERLDRLAEHEARGAPIKVSLSRIASASLESSMPAASASRWPS